MLTHEVIDNLQKVIGRESVITDIESLLCYSYDATRIEVVPDVLLRPKTREDVASILKIASNERIPVVPRGSGSGFAGASVPVKGGIVLSLQCMDRILEINKDDFYAVVEPGVITRDLQKAAEEEGLFYPPDPSSVNFCTIGGNISTGAGGARGIKYGTTRDYVMGLEVVLASGEIVSTGIKTTRSVAGYDLTRLITGSEGTLGVITKATVRLVPLPEKIVTAVAVFPTLYSATSTIDNILKSAIKPLVLEFMDRESIRVVRELLPIGVRENGEAMIIVELDGIKDIVEKEILEVKEICIRSGAINVEIAGTSAEREILWKARRAISPALYKINPTKINEDVVVPRSKLSDLVREIGRIASSYNLQIVSFGHAGDGNLHVNIMIDDKDREEYNRAKEAVRSLFEATLRLGGSISGEHGIGITKAPYLSMEVGDRVIGIMKDIKRVFDPNNILNPGKLWK